MSLSIALATAAVFTDGDWVETKDQDPDGDVRLVQLADVGDGTYLQKSARFLTSEKARSLHCTFLSPGDILLARMPDPLGRACIFPGDKKPAVTVVDVCVIRPDETRHDTRWLMHSLNSPDCRMQISALATGTTRSRISRGNLATIRLTVPPLPQQRRMATVLDCAEALRAKRRAALAQLDTLAHAIFLDLFGDPGVNREALEVRPLGEICDVRDGTHDSPKYLSSGGYPLVTSKNLSSGFLDLANVSLIDKDDYDQINKRSKVDHGDILMPMIGTIGSPVIVHQEPRFAIKNVALIKFTASSPSPILVHHLLSSDYFDRFVRQTNRGGTQKFLSLGDIRAFPVPVPPVPLQNEFARRVATIDKLKATQRASLAHVDALFASLQHRAFRGEL